MLTQLAVNWMEDLASYEPLSGTYDNWDEVVEYFFQYLWNFLFHKVSFLFEKEGSRCDE